MKLDEIISTKPAWVNTETAKIRMIKPHMGAAGTIILDPEFFGLPTNKAYPVSGEKDDTILEQVRNLGWVIQNRRI